MYRLDVALDLEILATEPYTGDYFLPEIKGLADASGVNYKASIYLTHHNHIYSPAYFCSSLCLQLLCVERILHWALLLFLAITYCHIRGLV